MSNLGNAILSTKMKLDSKSFVKLVAILFVLPECRQPQMRRVGGTKNGLTRLMNSHSFYLSLSLLMN